MQFPTRREWLASTLAVAAGAAIACSESSSLGNEESTLGKRKKGYCCVPKHPHWQDILTSLNAHWFYTWSARRPENVPEGIDWVPMIWGDNKKGAANAVLDHLKDPKTSKPSAVLGYNEPDEKRQAHMSVDDALELWPKLEALNLPLGSPAGVHADAPWMKQFMKEAIERKYRIDFVTVHWYGDPSANGLIQYSERIAKMYDRPVWFTEFCPGDWSAKKPEENKHDEKAVLKFLQEALPRLEKSSVVQRYCWFCASPTDAALCCSVLVNSDGSLTKLGKAFAEIG